MTEKIMRYSPHPADAYVKVPHSDTAISFIATARNRPRYWNLAWLSRDWEVGAVEGFQAAVTLGFAIRSAVCHISTCTQIETSVCFPQGELVAGFMSLPPPEAVGAILALRHWKKLALAKHLGAKNWSDTLRRRADLWTPPDHGLDFEIEDLTDAQGVLAKFLQIK